MNKMQQRLLHPSKATRQDRFGKTISLICIGFIMILTVSIIGFIAIHGLATFFENHVSVMQFIFSSNWNPGQLGKNGQPQVGAFAMIVASFAVTLLAAILATPFAIAVALYMTELAPKRGAKMLQPVIELLVGIPSVVYGFIGLVVIVPAIRSVFGGTGFGILAGSIVLFVMILPTITSLTIDSLQQVPDHYRKASLALGATKWQTIYKVILRAALPGILTAIVFGMARAFGEALAVQMVIGNAALTPTSLTSPTATLTSQLTSQMGDTIMGTLPNNALWSLALVLLIMSVIFNLLIKVVGKRGEMKK
ncbi:phosphate ABC transporter permease subunit PstC [Fructilactobacillus lindneri]|nr:phosphate ABC transporter permease subunit PstC [Fructilactobacillus lindneri]ANZ57395.1 phosphate ABC transporter permease subunit PstC [Fructilactobacillus lindneri]ANZ58661.1 phosphate ABC transporter permease subunit PstC [Fructilactobacillus lindneri]POG97880.1 phosphate ABC transporter permease subunit PstC [Fructilactobacillus lindneri]POG99212.1 phosphate ABC transporter permease subunit PstC [Fructilactobacillus lindneri]POH01849.1 phosphate ABC transporter permease subunit PstC [F